MDYCYGKDLERVVEKQKCPGGTAEKGPKYRLDLIVTLYLPILLAQHKICYHL
jgi:hypothetical protein